MTIGELQNPRKNMAKAVKRIFWRILFFYVFGEFEPISSINKPRNRSSR